MWRALFLAIGIYLMILGVECLGVEKANLKIRDDPPPPVSPWDTEAKVGPQMTITPPRWAPWSLMSSGAVVCLYSFTIPRRVKGS
ncbi:MAG: hypothetical protein A2V70_18625 [Planctomycetes bacterium RBG_13_63_9]|nr:MAG: hypothetical protein A2V70_18625 [Planctomycetes bacterium RBG_13_63_9]